MCCASRCAPLTPSWRRWRAPETRCPRVGAALCLPALCIALERACEPGPRASKHWANASPAPPPLAGRVTHRLLLTYKLSLAEGGKCTPTLPMLNRWVACRLPPRPPLLACMHGISGPHCLLLLASLSVNNRANRQHQRSTTHPHTLARRPPPHPGPTQVCV